MLTVINLSVQNKALLKYIVKKLLTIAREMEKIQE